MQGEDLFAREAQFHPSCRKSFNLKYINCLRDTARTTSCDKTDTDQDRKAHAHLKAFTVVLDFIQDCVIGQNKVVLLASLRRLYTQELEKNGFPNPEYRSEKLKARLENSDIHELIAFAKVTPGDKGCINYTLVYSASISTHISWGPETSMRMSLCSFVVQPSEHLRTRSHFRGLLQLTIWKSIHQTNFSLPTL